MLQVTNSHVNSSKVFPRGLTFAAKTSSIPKVDFYFESDAVSVEFEGTRLTIIRGNKRPGKGVCWGPINKQGARVLRWAHDEQQPPFHRPFSFLIPQQVVWADGKLSMTVEF